MNSKTHAFRAIMAALVSIILLAASVGHAQIRQTALYIDDGFGGFTILKTANHGGGGTLTFPSGTGSVLMASPGMTAGVALQSLTPGTSQTGNFNITGTGILAMLTQSTSGAAASGSIGANFTNNTTNTTDAGGAWKNGISVTSTGTWTGSDASGVNYGIALSVSGGHQNYDIFGTDGVWSVDNTGAGSFNTISATTSATATTPLSATINGGPQTTDVTAASIANGASSSTAGINKIGLAISNTGPWNASSDVNTALSLTATGGATNYDIKGTGNHWSIDASGNLATNGTGSFGGARYEGSQLEVIDGAANTSNGSPLVLESTNSANAMQMSFERVASDHFAVNAIEQGVGSKNIVFMDQGGNFGVGTTNPSTLFSVGTGVTSNLTVDASGNLSTSGTLTSTSTSGITSGDGSHAGRFNINDGSGHVVVLDNENGADGQTFLFPTTNGTLATEAYVDNAASATNFIQNQNAVPQSSANFNISGDGTIGGMLHVTDIEDPPSLSINTSSGGPTTIGNSTGGVAVTGTHWSIGDANSQFAFGQGSSAALFSFATGWTCAASGFYSTAVGDFSTASGTNSVAIGDDAVATGSNAITIGSTTQAIGDYSVVLGQHATDNNSSNGGSFVFGDNSTSNWVGANNPNEFDVRAAGGVHFYTKSDLSTGVSFPANGGLSVTGGLTIDASGHVTAGAWQGTAIAGQYGGTGVANTGKTITLGGNLSTSGAAIIGSSTDNVTLETTGATDVTLPTSGTLATTSAVGTAIDAAISGTTNNVAKFTSTNVVGNSALTDDGTSLSYSGTHINSGTDYQIGGSTVFASETSLNYVLSIGKNAHTVGTNSTYIGTGAGNSTGGDADLVVGQNAWVLGGAGSDNTIIGTNAAYYSTSDHNTMVGYESGWKNGGNHNTYIGEQAGYNNASFLNGNDNVYLGTDAGDANTGGSNNTFLGQGATANGAAYSNATALGSGATVTAGNTIQLGNTSVTAVNTSGALTSGDGTHAGALNITDNASHTATLNNANNSTATFSFPSTGGTLATTGGTVAFDNSTGQTATDGADLFSITSQYAGGANPGAFLSSVSTGSNDANGLNIAAAGGTGATLTGLLVTAIGGTNNYAIIVPPASGNVGIGVSAPAALLSVGASSALQVDATGNLSTSGTITSTSTSGITSGGNSAAGALKISDGAVSAAYGTIGFTASHFTFGGAYIDMGGQDINNAGDGQFNTLEAAQSVTVGDHTSHLGSIGFNDGTHDASNNYTGTLNIPVLTGSYTWTLPNASGTLALDVAGGYLPLSGGLMSGNIDMGTHSISNAFGLNVDNIYDNVAAFITIGSNLDGGGNNFSDIYTLAVGETSPAGHQLTVDHLGTLSTSGNISTTGSGNITAAGSLTAGTAGITSGGIITINSGGNGINIAAGGTDDINGDDWEVTIAGDATFSGIDNTPIGANIPYTGAFTTFSAGTGTLTVDASGNLSTTGNIKLGNGTNSATLDAPIANGNLSFSFPSVGGTLATTLSAVNFSVSSAQTNTTNGNYLFDLADAPTSTDGAGALITTTGDAGGDGVIGLTINASTAHPGGSTTVNGIRVAATGGNTNNAIDVTNGDVVVEAGNLSTSGTITSTSTSGITSGNATNAGKIVIYDAIPGHFATINAPDATNAPVFNLPAESGAGPFTLATSGNTVLFDNSTAQTATDANDLFNLADAPSSAGDAPGAIISTTANGSAHNATGLTLNTAAGGTGTAAGIVFNTSAGSTQYDLFGSGGTFPGTPGNWSVTSAGAISTTPTGNNIGLTVTDTGSGAAISASDGGTGTGQGIYVSLTNASNHSSAIHTISHSTGANISAANTGSGSVIDATDANAGTGSGLSIELGNPSNASNAISISNGGTGNDITGNNGHWSVTSAGVGAFASSLLNGASSVTNASLSINQTGGPGVGVGGHIQSQQAIKPATTASANISGVSLTDATDVAGKVSFTVTSGVIGNYAEVDFNGAYTTAPIVVITAADGPSAISMSNFYVAPHTGNFQITLDASLASGTYTYYYHVIETVSN